MDFTIHNISRLCFDHNSFVAVDVILLFRLFIRLQPLLWLVDGDIFSSFECTCFLYSMLYHFIGFTTSISYFPFLFLRLLLFGIVSITICSFRCYQCFIFTSQLFLHFNICAEFDSIDPFSLKSTGA